MKSDSATDLPWQVEVPYDTRQEAIGEAITAFKAAITNKRNGNIQHFEIGFRSKKTMRSQSFRVNKNTLNISTLSLFPTRLKNKKKLRVRKRDQEKIKNEFEKTECNFVITKIRPSEWYLCLPKEKRIPIYENATYKSVFMDPGVRTFQTFYSPDGVCGKIEAPKDLEALGIKHDKLWSLMDRYTSKTKRHMRLRCAKIRKKIKDKIDNMHWQTCSFLCTHFRDIFLPEFKVSQMVTDSKLQSKVIRKMLQLSHGAFRERLIYFAKTKHRSVHLVGEAYTTKTCGQCGALKEMGGLKTYKCPHCSCEIDRDYNGARNICLKLLSKAMTS